MIPLVNKQVFIAVSLQTTKSRCNHAYIWDGLQKSCWRLLDSILGRFERGWKEVREGSERVLETHEANASRKKNKREQKKIKNKQEHQKTKTNGCKNKKTNGSREKNTFIIEAIPSNTTLGSHPFIECCGKPLPHKWLRVEIEN